MQSLNFSQSPFLPVQSEDVLSGSKFHDGKISLYLLGGVRENYNVLVAPEKLIATQEPFAWQKQGNHRFI